MIRELVTFCFQLFSLILTSTGLFTRTSDIKAFEDSDVLILSVVIVVRGILREMSTRASSCRY